MTDCSSSNGISRPVAVAGHRTIEGPVECHPDLERTRRPGDHGMGWMQAGRLPRPRPAARKTHSAGKASNPTFQRAVFVMVVALKARRRPPSLAATILPAKTHRAASAASEQAGTVYYRPGPLLAEFHVALVIIRGKGRPWCGARGTAWVDPVRPGGAAVLDFETIVERREIEPLEPAVLTVASIHGWNEAQTSIGHGGQALQRTLARSLGAGCGDSSSRASSAGRKRCHRPTGPPRPPSRSTGSRRRRR